MKPSYKYYLQKSIKFQIGKRGKGGEDNITTKTLFSADQRMSRILSARLCAGGVWEEEQCRGRGREEEAF